MIDSGETSQSYGISKYRELRRHMVRAWGPIPSFSVHLKESRENVFVLNTVAGLPEGFVRKAP